MRLMSFAETWRQFKDGSKIHTLRLKQVWTDGDSYFAKRPAGPGRKLWDDDFEKIWIPAWWNHRIDEPTLKHGEIFEGVEWSPRVGKRWTCTSIDCPWVGDTRLDDPNWCDLCLGLTLSYRKPERGFLARHLGTEIVCLGDGDDHEAGREGFPGMSWPEFCAKNFKGVSFDTKVARVSFERIES